MWGYGDGSGRRFTHKLSRYVFLIAVLLLVLTPQPTLPSIKVYNVAW